MIFRVKWIFNQGTIFKGVLMGRRQDEVIRNSIDTAIGFYFQQLDKDISPAVRKQYVLIAKDILNAAPKHPRREEYEKKLKSYEVLS